MGKAPTVPKVGKAVAAVVTLANVRGADKKGATNTMVKPDLMANTASETTTPKPKKP